MAREKGTGSLQQESSGRWTMRLCVNGTHYSKTTRTRDRVLAEEELRIFAEEHGGGDGSLRFRETWDAYVASPLRRNLRVATLDSKKRIWENFLLWIEANYNGTNELRLITADMVGKYLAEARVDHAATTYNSRICVLREIFRTLKGRAGLVRNPWEGVRLMPDDSHVRRALTVKEVTRLTDCAKAIGDDWRKLFQIGLYTGLRLGDCCRLNWQCVDLGRGIIQIVPRKTEKYAHGRPVTIPIHPVLAGLLNETPEGERNGAVMPEVYEMYRVSRSSVSYRLKKIFRAAQIVTSVAVEGRRCRAPEATFHSLRHTFVSLAANAGVPLHIVQSIVGHESTAMTRHYYHEDETALRQAVAAIPDIVHCEPVPPPQAPDATSSLWRPETLTELKTVYETLHRIFGPAT